MKKLITIIFLAILLCHCIIHADEENIEKQNVVNIYMDKTYQTIDGFGASYTWYCEWLSGANRAEEGFDWIFNDAEFNIIRFRDQHDISGAEKNIPLEGYKSYKAYYDAAVSRGIQPIVMVTSWGQYDRELPFVRFVEKSEKGYSYYTLAKDKNGQYMYDEFAQFCVQSIQYFLDAGIPVDYFSISNEIELQERHTDENGKAREEAGFFWGMEETKDYGAYWKAHIAVYNAFRDAFGDNAPSIIGAETMAGENKYLHGYLRELMDNYKESFQVVAHHLYGTALTKDNFKSIYDNFKDYRIWQTEWYTHDYFYLGDIILNELVNENICAFLYWNGVWVKDEGNCLIEVSSWEPTAQIKRNPGHYIMMHYSKFIKKGYKRVHVSENLNARVGAFKSEDNTKLVVIVSNNTTSEDILNIPMEYNIVDSKIYQSIESNNTYMNELGEYEEGMVIPAKSLTTIVFELENSEDEIDYIEDKSQDRQMWIIGLGILVFILTCILFRKKICKDSTKQK